MTSVPYEFDSKDGKVIGTLGRRARLWGVMSVVGGAIGLAALIGGLVALAHFAEALARYVPPEAIAIAVIAITPLAIVSLVTGGMYVSAGSRLLAAERTQGRDVDHLLLGLVRMTGAVKLETVMSVIGLVMTIAAYVGGLWVISTLPASIGPGSWR